MEINQNIIFSNFSKDDINPLLEGKNSPLMSR